MPKKDKKVDKRLSHPGLWAIQAKEEDPEVVRERMLKHMALMTARSKKVKTTARSLEEVKEALIKNEGYIANTARALGISYMTMHKYLHKVWPDTLEPILRTIREARTDRVESKMMQRIDEGSDYLIRYYLSSQGKSRGYGEQVAAPANQTVNILYVNDWRNPDLSAIEGDYEEVADE